MRNHYRFGRHFLIASVLAALTALSSCASDGSHRTAGQTVDDATLTGRVKTALVNDPLVEAMDINVDTYRGVVQLTGYVDTQRQVDRAVEIARSFEVKDVKNNLRVKDSK